MGLGSFGGGVAAARHLHHAGYEVLATDLATREKLGPALDGLPEGVELALGGHVGVDFEACDLLVVNPAVPRPWDNPNVTLAKRAGARLTTEIGLLLDTLPADASIVGITGTAGKSTTSAMVHHGLLAAGQDAVFGGNIGGSLLERLDEIGPETVVVLELSSAMLWWLDQPGTTARPVAFEVAAITNLLPNHLDWHGSFEHYRAAKQVLASRCTQTLVVGDDTAWETRARRAQPPAFAGPLVVPGAHNRRNAGVAAGVLDGLGVADCSGLATFPGLPHRLRLVHTSASGVRWYDDSKSTVPGATKLAVEALAPEGPVYLIAGGYDKGVGLGEIAHASRVCAGVWTIGATGAALAQACERASDRGTLDEAVRAIAGHLGGGAVGAGGSVLLSPGCASWDQFENYEQRGRRFAQLAREVMP